MYIGSDWSPNSHSIKTRVDIPQQIFHLLPFQGLIIDRQQHLFVELNAVYMNTLVIDIVLKAAQFKLMIDD